MKIWQCHLAQVFLIPAWFLTQLWYHCAIGWYSPLFYTCFFSETAWACHPCHLWSINAYVFCWHLKWNEWIFVTTGVFKCWAACSPFLWLFCSISMKAEKQCILGNFHTWKFEYPFVRLWHDWSSFVCSHNDQIIHQDCFQMIPSASWPEKNHATCCWFVWMTCWWSFSHNGYVQNGTQAYCVLHIVHFLLFRKIVYETWSMWTMQHTFTYCWHIPYPNN